ncbi:MAG: hypothetical protein LBD11_08070 [Candidatus Peribacteria bacterium]|jgi:hypothetical protein|nr:hypothetical protein [Candidatus Peribacteria bacterium]
MVILIEFVAVLGLIVLLVRFFCDDSAWLVIKIKGQSVKVKTTKKGKKFVLDCFKPGDTIGFALNAGKYCYDPVHQHTMEGIYEGVWDGEKLIVPNQSESSSEFPSDSKKTANHTY